MNKGILSLLFALLPSFTLGGLEADEVIKRFVDPRNRVFKENSGYLRLERFFYLETLNPGESLNDLGFPSDFTISSGEEVSREFSLALDALEEEVSGLSEVETVYLKALIVTLRTTVWRGGTEGVEKILPVVESYQKNKIAPLLASDPGLASLFRVSGDLSVFIGSHSPFPLALGFFGEAKKSYRKALRRDKNNGRAAISLGVIALFIPEQAGGPYLAIEFFDRAAERDDHPVVQLNSGVWKAYAYAREGRKMKALEIIDAVVEEFPFSRWAHQVKKQITDEALPF